MDKEKLISAGGNFVDSAPENVIGESAAIEPGVVGLRIFERPIFGFADAHDPLFEGLRAPEAVGSGFMPPDEWLCGAASVFSFFLPFTEEVKKSNVAEHSEISPEWLHGRIEGQKLILLMSQYLTELLRAEGFEAVSPAADGRFKTFRNREGLVFSSCWSERHVAYISGLGTFGLSKGLITEKGVAGRFGSIITTARFEPTKRTYTGLYDNCTNCGACAKRCPVGAIDPKTGKDHVKCSEFLNTTKEKYAPRYGCGKCQTAVPCQSRIPQK